VDEESGVVELVRADDVRHSVENVVAIFVVASLLLIVAGVLGWLALGSGVFE
jgi:putative exporter of polyketide antibiotics